MPSGEEEAKLVWTFLIRAEACVPQTLLARLCGWVRFGV